jgi:hypothetical protein
MVTKYHLFQKHRHKNYNYVDNITKTYIEMGGCLLHIYPLLGTYDSAGNLNLIEDGKFISDSVLNENNRRKYSHTTYDLWATTTMNPPNYSFTYAGISILDGDVQEFSLHYNSMIAALGRKIIVGDVIEMTWQRDLDVLGKNKGQNKFYYVTSSERDENGWGPEWHYHLWKLKCKPIYDGPEFADLFQKDESPIGGEDGFYEEIGSENGGGGLDADASQNNQLQDQVDDILKEAEGEDGNEENGWNATGVSYRLYDEHHVFLDIRDKYYIGEYDKAIGIDGIPNELTCEEVDFGESFPRDIPEGHYFLRTDFMPPKLFKRIAEKTMTNTINIIYEDIRIVNAELNVNGKNFDGSINDNGSIVGSIIKDKVYINGTYIGCVTDSGKIIANNGTIIGTIEQEEHIHRMGWSLEPLEHDRRERWTGVPMRLRRAINNEQSFVNAEGDVEPMRQNIKDLANRRVKKEHNRPRPWNKELQQEIEDETSEHFHIIGMDYPSEEEETY